MSPHRKSLLVLTLLAAACALPWHWLLGRAEAQSGTPIRVDVASGRHPIDPRIYGVNWATSAQLQALNAPIQRWGGNHTSRYNWKQNADNRGSDWYFESIPYASSQQGAEADSFVSLSRQGGAEPMLTVPLVGWVARLGAGRSKLASFSATKYGPQQDCDWSWFPDACNGVRTSGTTITGNDPADASTRADAQFQKEWIQHLVARWGGAAGGGVRYYIYDNEPSIWYATHRDVHPAGLTMAELRDAMITFGSAVRQADPNALLVGPEEWGWSAYFYSGYDQKYGADTGCWFCAPDRDANGGMDYMPWLLDQLQQHERQTGERLLDVFTVHYYPQGGEYQGGTSSSLQALRNRSTRSLWDPNYRDESWIADRVRLIPRMKEWVNAYYPGRELGITEYSWGAHNHINGATAQADVLGIFGREGLNVGTLWTTPAASTPTFKAIQMYRNYDGARSSFGDVSVEAAVVNPDSLSAFAAERSGDGALTVMAINKVSSSALVDLTLANFTPAATAQVFQLTAANTIRRLADVSVVAGAISASVPAQSITLFVIPGAEGGEPSLSIADVAVGEGDTGSASAEFSVSLSAASAETVSVSYATADGGALAGSDYTAVSGVLSFSPGETRKAITVPVIGDTAIENDETFTLTLSGPSHATIADGVGLGTVLNDDFPGLTIGDVSVVEGNSGVTHADFEVALSEASPFGVSVNYATADGTAQAGSDYAATTGNLSFAAGETRKTIAVNVTGDLLVEPDESFFVDLSSPLRATLVDPQGQGRIINDDGGPPPPGTPESVVWTATVGVSVSGGSLTKTARWGWGNAGAISTQQITSGDGYVEVTASETTTYRMFGLSNGNSDSSYRDIDFAIYQAAGRLRVFERGVSRGSFGSYQPGDSLRVAVVGGVVRYSRNGAVFYTSTLAPVYPLLVDSALYSRGATIRNAVIHASAGLSSVLGGVVEHAGRPARRVVATARQ